MKIDLHVHCMERSICGKSSEEEQIAAAIDSGLDAIVFTDHDRLMPEKRLQELNHKYAPFRIFGGIEVSLEGEHMIVLGVNEPRLETLGWVNSELHQFVHEKGGFMAIAHPFRYGDTINIDLKAFPPDAIEAVSNNTPESEKEKICKIAADLGIPILCNSDSHESSTIGKYYNIFQHVPEDEAELIHMLRDGEFRCGVS